MSYALETLIILALTLACAAQAGEASHPAVRVAMCQIPVEDGDLAGNMKLAEDAVLRAVKDKAELICLPEAADWGWLYQEARRDALPIPGRYTDLLCRLAKDNNVWICGGCLEKDGEKTYNSAVLINRKGEIVLKHRKIETLRFLTKNLYDAGSASDIKAVDTEFGRLGITICADNFKIRNARRVAELGAWLLITPHGFAAEESELEKNGREFQAHIRSVARQTGLWVIGTNTVLGTVKGGAWKGRPHSGCSTIACPHGAAAAVAKFKEPDLVVYDIPAQ